MKLHHCFIAVALGLAVVGTSNADSIKTAKGSVPGQIMEMSPEKVVIETNNLTKDVPVNEIQTIFYDSDPAELKMAKTHVLNSRYAEAQTALERIKEDEAVRPENLQDIEFYKALCAAKLALAGNGKIADAGRMMIAFVDKNDKSYHYFAASEIVGDLLVAIRSYAQAAKYYARLEKAPWADYKMRAGVAAGRALLAQGKVGEAQNAFDRVISTSAEGDLAQSQRLAAKVGKAATMVASKKTADAIKLTEDVLRAADPEDVPLMARAYNVLGSAHRQAGRPKEALLAYLHVDVLYPSQPDAHAEALANLVELWEQVHKTERANAARRMLDDEYKDSPWNQKVSK